MDNKIVISFLVFLVALVVSTGARGIPSDDKENEVLQQEEERSMKDRATWLDTRDLEEEFKELVFLAIHELANEGRVDPKIISSKGMEKRGRWQGFCFRRTRSGRFLPYICWKGARK